VEAKALKWRPADNNTAAMQTTMRLLARIDELEDDLETTACELHNLQKRRSEPMPKPVPKWLKAKVCEDAKTRFTHDKYEWRHGTFALLAARLIWERGDVEPVDPLLSEARKLLAMEAPDTAYERRCLEGQHDGCIEFKIITLALKRGMELAKEIG
jgi:hypothetical protein